MTQEEIKNSYSFWRNFKAVVPNFPHREVLAALQAIFSKFIKNMFFHELYKEGADTNSSYESTIILIPKETKLVHEENFTQPFYS